MRVLCEKHTTSSNCLGAGGIETALTGISDIETLRKILPPASLLPAAVGDDMWGVHKAGMWLDESVWAPLFGPAGKENPPR